MFSSGANTSPPRHLPWWSFTQSNSTWRTVSLMKHCKGSAPLSPSSSAGIEYSQPGSRFEYISCRYPGLWAAAELWYLWSQNNTVAHCWHIRREALRSTFNLSEELIVCWGGGHAGDVTALIWALKHFLSALHLFIMRSWNKHCWWTRQRHENTTHLAALKSMTPPTRHTEWHQALSV